MNILPQSKKDQINKGYKMRILVTSFWAAFFTFVVCATLMFPAYIIARSKLSATNARKAINSEATKEQIALVNAPQLVNQKATLALQSLKSVSRASRMVAISTTSKSGIIIKNISYQKQKITISGLAVNRDVLILFKEEILKIDFVKDSLVPVGDFAKDKDLSFTMTINVKEEARN